ncbi:M23 family metallopeptidase [Bacillus carboniphilus]|uniref:M23 family metallopeptidase n=1 Tax=Bacillus carboniphilus TaxID=86663 RepID=A0ABN0VXX4_9BACI
MREEEKKRPSQNSGTQRKNKWIFPAVYIAAAALLLTAVVWFSSTGDDAAQDPADTENPVTENDGDSVVVNTLLEDFVWPVENPEEAKVVNGFWSADASKEEQESALVFYNNQFRPNKGIDLAMENGESFNVVASMAGQVSAVREDAELGNVIEIQHAEGVVTMYQSVTDIQVEVGDQVEQGQVLAKAGQSLLNQAAGTHAHFEVRVDGVAVDPQKAFGQSLSAVAEMATTPTTAPEEEADENADNSQSEENDDSEGEAGEADDTAEDTDDAGEDQEESPDASIGQNNA